MNVPIEHVKSFYDEAIYRKLHGFIYKNTRIEYAWQSLLNILNYTEPKHILEIGCGMGEIGCRLADKLPMATVTGFDVSERSISLAKKLFVRHNLDFLRADSVEELNLDTKYDLIFLMDVYEHIPVSSRAGLHLFIKKQMAEGGFLFLSCPTPQHLDHLKINIPTEIQPVDEDISLEVLQTLSFETGLKLINYKEVSVWKAADYLHVVFSNKLKMQPFSDYIPVEKKESIGIGLKKELRKKIKKALKKTAKQDDPENEFDFKRELISKSLGKEVLDKVEAYGK
jgi:2-polyprenyl-3-methyl-5-hydroxy-6-metoxy-1,4-benzoquinol methylase